jgi:F-type H+-transporting ATPase subunit delta
MIKLDIAERYSKVLFDLDLKKDAFENRLWDFENMSTLIESNPTLVEFLKSPQISIDEKKKLLTTALSSHFDEDFLQFLVYLIERKRFDYLKSIAKKYRDLVDEHLGIWEAELVTPVPLEPHLESKLVDMLEKSFDKKINVVPKIQPNIIGGSILIILNKMVDWSITGRLKKLKESLLERKHDI